MDFVAKLSFNYPQGLRFYLHQRSRKGLRGDFLFFFYYQALPFLFLEQPLMLHGVYLSGYILPVFKFMAFARS